MSVNISLNVTAHEEYDVIVIGGGSTGVCAADAAARTGAKTLLVEKNGMLGGTTTSAYVVYPGIFHFWGRQIITGPCWELFLRLEKIGGVVMPKNEYAPKHISSQQLRIDPFLMAVEMERLLKESDVKILMHTMISFAEETDDGMNLIFTGKEGMWAAHAKKVIDCTGDANVAGMLGYERVRSEVLQPATYANRLEGYNLEDIDEEEVNAAFEKAFDAGYLDRHLFSWKKPYIMLKRRKLDMHIPCPGAESSEEKTYMELEGHEILARMLEVYRSVKGCEGIKVNIFAAECGIRETCRIVGEETMDVDRYLSGYVYDDAVCYAFYPVDAHTLNGIHNIYFAPDVYGTVPYRALIPKGSKHLLVAGRTVSSDSETNSAVRVQAPCMAMGTAAGVAAAITAKKDQAVMEIAYGELADGLKKLGATVPEKK